MNLPTTFTDRMQTLLGEKDYTLFLDALQQAPPVSVRMNLRKGMKLPIDSTPVSWCTTGCYLDKRPTFTFDPQFHAGGYYVQEASSMFVEQALKSYVHSPVVMLDLCAAPGGKSTLCRSVLPEGSFLVANEVMRNRSQILAENLIKWGDPGVVVTNNDPADFAILGPVFDVILTDVPCSGEGMFRKDEVAVEEWSLENVELCAQRQRRILGDIWSTLKPGGLLIYSTCTFNTEENEANVAWIARELGAEILPLEIPSEWNITGNLSGKDFPVYRFLPHRTAGEGLFLAILRKHEEGKEEAENSEIYKYRQNKKGKHDRRKEKASIVPQEIKHWLSSEKDWSWQINEETVRAIPAAYETLYTHLKSVLKILHAGVTVCELKGKDWIPHHSLAMSTFLESEQFPKVEITYEQAVSYLRKEAIILSPEVPKGMVLVQYKGISLGFVKHIGNRANNLYPQEWRIRSKYLPEDIQLLK